MIVITVIMYKYITYDIILDDVNPK